MWKYVRKYLHFAVLAGCLMVGEVLMDLIQPGLMSRIVDEGILGLDAGGTSDMQLIWSLGLRMILLVLFGGLCGALNNVFSHLAAQNIGNVIRKDAFGRIMSFSFRQMDGYGTGSLVVRVTNDITQIQNFVSTFFRGIIRTSILTIGSIICMYSLDPHFGIIMLCIFPFLIGFLACCLLKTGPLFSRLQDEIDKLNSVMQEDVSGIRIIKACVRETYEKLRFGKVNKEIIGIQLHTLFIFAMMNPVINMLIYLAVGLILLAGAEDVAYGAASPGTVMAAITYTTTMLNGILGLVMVFQNISRGSASWGRVKEILETPADGAAWTSTNAVKTSGDDAADSDAAGKKTSVDAGPADTPVIEFRDVSFSYPGSNHPVLDHINLKIYKGETVAVMGATGCGKTSLVNLIPRFYDVTEGAVLVDGADVRTYGRTELRYSIAFVLQKTELFSASISENISWGREGAGPDEIKAAATAAQADSFIMSAAEAYDTLVAERGMSLSGGQKQRIAIARAILKKAPIMIFDDATSALDLKTEADFYRALEKSNPGATKIIVAQRIASVRGADRIIVLDNHGIAASGTHQELMVNSGVYQEIYQSQFGGEASYA